MVYSISMMVTAIFLVLATSVNAHMKMLTPTPYGNSTLNNYNLYPNGSDFPCKLRAGVYDLEGAQNIMTIGEPQTLSFEGSATHGGGSCQVALTTDLQPTVDSKWQVVLSIEGGCPTNATGNLDGPFNAVGLASVFNYTIPEGIAPGQYTIAWAWINRVGNREFYMNCGPATVIAPKKKRYAPAPKLKQRDTPSFPDLFVANLESVNDCVTYPDFDFAYPNPGSEVVRAGTGPMTTLTCAATLATANVAAQSPTGTMTETAIATSATSASSPAFAGTTAAATSSSIGVQIVPTSTTTSAAAIATSSSSSSSSSGSSAGSPCTNEGAWACSSDGSSFARCASGLWSALIQMPAGMKCTPGVSNTFNETPAKVKRHLHGHVRRIAQMIGAY
ncbi:hypothetical protein LTR10_013801 [Elasticomyces elasticus]|uniref:Lytic polysaccharide monooxygenase n=1 Tax=Exophiala sideris TaxID=1016849 RepID=A0ABR0JID0_9EURO|nr:hypothetical protein LTR10_013801 [Elasticomyces elasticus]KAK5033224.1 hypothetical protein LTS07_003525 [Exophiala sideris]KAK5042279.1 hypothetical protein LTR13_002085 [Exophiala sideris]KAK5063768.1 hypothetical protein LTR69_003533 [Exophiala sideris]KAK5185547.1 hypothetical protein LTR44_002536 [Eurotiomycetes sp. CCFEE 6388]